MQEENTRQGKKGEKHMACVEKMIEIIFFDVVRDVF